MPLYEYECRKGHKTERMRTVAQRNNSPACCECGDQTRKVTCAHIRSEEPVWLPSAVDNLPADAKDKINDRTTFNEYLDDKGLQQVG